METDLRTATRYFLHQTIPAELGGMRADIVDLSVKGARLQLTEGVAVGMTLPFSMKAVMTNASVLWCEMAAISLSDEESDRYLCGVSFERSLPVIGHLLANLVADGSAVVMEESRVAERYRVSAPMTASFDQTSGARVLDISVRGTRLGTATRMRVGTSGIIRFRLNDQDLPVDLPATVMWSRPAERIGRFETGLRIDGGEDWLRAVIDELSLQEQVTVDPKSLHRKFDPFAAHPVSGLVGLLR